MTCSTFIPLIVHALCSVLTFRTIGWKRQIRCMGYFRKRFLFFAVSGKMSQLKVWEYSHQVWLNLVGCIFVFIMVTQLTYSKDSVMWVMIKSAASNSNRVQEIFWVKVSIALNIENYLSVKRIGDISCGQNIIHYSQFLVNTTRLSNRNVM